MSGETRSFTFEQTVPAAPGAVYRAFTSSTALREWFCDIATTAPREGGRCYLAWNDGYYSSGQFLHLVPGQEVSYSWHGRDEPAVSRVQITLESDGENTRVCVVHSNVGTGPEWSGITPALEKDWAFSLENLDSIFRTGADLRFTQRPMLGISLSDFDSHIAEDLGVPVNEGIRLDDVLPEMGAGAAGLQANDVIVGIDNKPVFDWGSLADALQNHRAGEEVEVTFYRGPERRQVRMILSGRPIPDIPWDIEALSGAVRQRCDEINEELADFFAGVSEAQAAYKPAPDAWSAREVLAHLIHSERDWQFWMSLMVDGHELWGDEFGSNLQARIDGTVAALPATGRLLEELRKLHDETVAFVAHLPPSFLQRKATYWRLAFQLLDAPFHHHTHLEQMREAIAAAP